MPRRKKAKSTVSDLEEIDLRILTELAKNSRASLKELSTAIGAPVSTIFSRIKKLEERGIIQKYTLSVDPKMLNYNITAIINFNIEGPYLEEFEKQLSLHPNVLSLYDITGDFDVVAVTRFKSIEELDTFVKTVLRNPHVKRTITSIVLRVVKESQPFVPLH